MFELGFEPLGAPPAVVMHIEAFDEPEAANSIGILVPAIAVAAAI